MKHQSNQLTYKKYLIPLIIITSLFFLWGFARAILDVLNKHLQNNMHISLTQSALIQVTTYLGYFLMALPAGTYISKHGYRVGVVTGLLIFALGAFLFIPLGAIGNYYYYLISLFVIGCGLVFLEISANPYVTELGPSSTSASRLNLAQSLNGMGCLFATLVVGQFFFSHGSGGSVVVPYTVLGVVVLCIALVFSRISLPEIVHDDATSQNENGSYATLLTNKKFVFGLTALLMYEVAEISINSYFINFVTAKDWMSDNTASVILTVGLALFMLGRFLGSWVMRYVKSWYVLAACALLCSVNMLVVLADFGRCSVVALTCNYLFEAIMFPTIFAMALSGLGGLTKRASSLLMMSPIGGCAFLAMGYLADKLNPVVPFIIPLVGYLVVFTFAVSAKKTA